MKTAVVQPNQSPLDAVLMACGTLEGAMQVIAANEASLTASLTAGTEYAIPAGPVTDKFSLQYLRQNKIIIGTKA